MNLTDNPPEQGDPPSIPDHAFEDGILNLIVSYVLYLKENGSTGNQAAYKVLQLLTTISHNLLAAINNNTQIGEEQENGT